MSVGILIPENLRCLGPECCFQGIGGANCLLPTSCSSTYHLPRSQWVDLLTAVHQLLDQGVITPVPAGECFQGFYLNLFFVPKPNGRVWCILDLKTLSGSEILHGTSLPPSFWGMSIYTFICSVFCSRQSALPISHHSLSLSMASRFSPRCFLQVLALFHSRDLCCGLDDLLLKKQSTLPANIQKMVYPL